MGINVRAIFLHAAVLLLPAGVLAGQEISPQKFEREVAQRAECPDGLSLYRTNKNKIYLGMPSSYSGRRILIGGTVTGVSDPGAVSIGSRERPDCYQVDLEDSLVVLSIPQTTASSPDSSYARALERNFIDPIFRRIPVHTVRADGGFVFDITSLVTAAAPRGKDFKPDGGNGTDWYGTPRAFSDNASIPLKMGVDLTGMSGKTTGRLCSTVSILVLPDEPMRPRPFDVRIGTFSTGSAGGGNRYLLSSERNGLMPYRLANRWRIEPSDTAAWLRGETVTVTKPIVWWVDDAFPPLWKEPVRQGVLAWNAAFEAFGLKDVLQVRDFPSDDPDFDPGDLRRNCIRYVPNTTANAMGPSWVDPATGEILGASVLVFNDVARLLGYWRFVQTAQADPSVRSRSLPDDRLQEALVYVVSHEIGHTLGLLHNMAASSAIPVDSLRSPSFTAVHGTTASIMDYARFNYVAQPGDKDVRLVPPSLGVYDRYAIEWLYKPVPQARDMWEEAAVAEALIDAHAGDPYYRYGPQAPGMAAVKIDPTARTQDLSDDAIRAGDYGVDNLKYILPNILEWISDDPDFSFRKELYLQLCQQFNRYLGNVEALLGGVELHYVKDGTPGDAFVTLPAERQQKALCWVVDNVRESAWLDEPALTRHFGLSVPESAKIAVSAGQYLGATAPQAVVIAAANGAEYTPRQYYDDLFKALFGRGKMTPQLQSLQRAVVSGMASRTAASKPKAALDDEEALYGSAWNPGQPNLDISAIDPTPGLRLTFLRRVAAYAKSRRSDPHFAAIYRTALSATE